jgi:hypothetical protein
MAQLRIEIRLAPSTEGKQELASWQPGTAFSPDFLVAASGTTCLYIGGKIIGGKKGANGLVAVTPDTPEADGLNSNLPDYTAGFAFGLAKAALDLKNRTKNSVNVKFVGEPIALRFTRDPQGTRAMDDDTVRLELSYNTEAVADAMTEIPLAEALAEIARSLLEFYLQLLRVNPQLRSYTEVAALREQISDILA